MKELRFKKQGIEFVLRNFEIQQDYSFRLVAEWKVVGIEENKANDGFYYNAEYLKSQNAFRFYFKYKGNKVGGVKLPDEIDIKSIIEAAKKEFEKKDIKKQQKLDAEYTDSKILNISYHTTYLFMLGDYGKSTRGKEISKKLENKKIARDVEEEIRNYQTDSDFSDYSITTKFKITVDEFERVVNKIYTKVENENAAKELAEEKRIAELFAKAKKTGKAQKIDSWSEECNDPNEECDLDNVIVYAMPDGTRKVKRYHTW